MPSGDRSGRVRGATPEHPTAAGRGLHEPVAESRIMFRNLRQILGWLASPEELHCCGPEGEQDADNRQHRGVHRGINVAQLADL